LFSRRTQRSLRLNGFDLTTTAITNGVSINGAEVFELLRDDLAAIEREFGRDTVSGVTAITEIGEYLRGG